LVKEKGASLIVIVRPFLAAKSQSLRSDSPCSWRIGLEGLCRKIKGCGKTRPDFCTIISLKEIVEDSKTLLPLRPIKELSSLLCGLSEDAIGHVFIVNGWHCGTTK
jgi:hypothetical protein